MANTLTNLIPDVYASLDTVSRELVGFIPAVAMDASANRVAQNQTLRSFVAPAATAATITPANTVPDSGTNTIANKTVTISNFRMVPIQWTGEEKLSMNSGGPGHRPILQNQILQGMRTLVNEIEEDLAGLYVGASRAYGTANTDPFASTLADTAQARKILADNGAPMSALQAVISTGAGAKFRTLGQVTKANEAGDTSLLRQGVLLDVHGFALRESGQIISPTVGTASSATTNAAGYAVGATVLTLASAGTGTIVAGDIVTFAGDTNKYVVASGDTDVSNGGTITLAQPGLKIAMSAATKAITVVASSAMNMVFDRNAIYLATRLPELPEGGDMAQDRFVVQDARSGLAFEFAEYRTYRQVHYELAIAWGVAMLKPEHCAIILGAV